MIIPIGICSINVPILGIVENMAWFSPEELPENKYYIFGEGGGKKIIPIGICSINVAIFSSIASMVGICPGQKINAHVRPQILFNRKMQQI